MQFNLDSTWNNVVDVTARPMKSPTSSRAGVAKLDIRDLMQNGGASNYDSTNPFKVGASRRRCMKSSDDTRWFEIRR